ncbi:unnamed protein product [Allacma fusca]|uniref:Uncharacterized protein n=1 Tax=Allacma fusca TaxID=39272 RepID=A0A8J2NXE2_9HEXA|nr:unnamed protein product [Allacma fusca]
MTALLLLPILAATLCGEVLSVEMPALGRYALIGELFDATANNFTGTLVFRKALPPQLGLVHQSDNPFTETTYTIYDSLSDKASFLKIGAELAIDITVSSVSLGIKGSGEFIKNEKKSRRHVEGVFAHKTLTKKESIQLTDEDVRPYVSTDILRESTATHVVTGAYYGGDVYVKFLDTNENNTDVTQIAGSLSLTLKTTQFSGNASGELNMTDSDITRAFSYSLEVFGDVTIPNIPGNALEVQNLIQKVPDLLKQVNGGKGKPMRYVLTPISEIRNALKVEGAIDKMVYQLDEDKLHRIMVTLDEISQVRQMLSDLARDFDQHVEIIPPPDRQRLRNLTADFEYTSLEFQSNVRDALVIVRTKGSQSLLTDVYRNYTLNEFSATNVRGKLQFDFEVLRRKMPFYDNFRGRNITYLGKSDSLGPFLIQAQSSIVYILYFNIELLDKDGAIWEENRELLGYIDKEWSNLAVLDCDFWTVQCAGMQHTVIQGYFKGRMGTVDARLDMPIRDESVKVLPAIGRSAKIGDLYDATTGKFTDESIFLSTKSHGDISDNPSFSLGYSKSFKSEGWEGLLREIQAPAELGSLLYREGIILEGSGEIFMPLYNPPNEMTSVVVWINRTRIETLNIDADVELFKLLDMATITRSTATHFIEKIEYGASTFVTFQNSSNPDQAFTDAQTWHGIIEDRFLTGQKKEGFILPSSNSTMKLFSDISPRFLHELDDEELATFLNGSSNYIKSYNDGKGLPVFLTLRPITILKKNFAVASRSEVVLPEHEELKREIVSQCGKLAIPVTCINRRFNFFDLALRKSVGFVHDEDTFADAFSDTNETYVYFLFFKYEWVANETASWVENSQKFFNLINSTAKFMMDCNFFRANNGSICDEVKAPAIYQFKDGKPLSKDYLKELLYQAVFEDGVMTNKLAQELNEYKQGTNQRFEEMLKSVTETAKILTTLEDATTEMGDKLNKPRRFMAWNVVARCYRPISQCLRKTLQKVELIHYTSNFYTISIGIYGTQEKI